MSGAHRPTLRTLLRERGFGWPRRRRAGERSPPADDTVSLSESVDGRRDDAAAGSGGAVPRGARLGRYLVLHALGSGGSANVYAAYDPELDRKIALKLLRGTADRSRLLREAQAAARLSHPNVVTVHDVGVVGERLFVAMELVEGTTLGDWLARPRPWREVVAVLLAAGEGLAAAHAAGLVHRDFKPSNVMVADDGRVLVLDFGLARDAGPAGGEPDDAPGRRHGTPAYMAPEQRRGGMADARSDQYSFCVTLYRALYGELPDPDAPRLPFRLRLPAAVRALLTRGLAADPDRRFESMEELVQTLAAVLGARRRRGQWATVAAAGALLAAALGSWSAATDRLCTGAEERLAGVWDEVVRARVGAAFIASGHPDAEVLWARTRAVIDAFARRWTEIHRSACEATRVRGEQSEHALDLQMACLDLRRQELATVAQVLAGADRELVERGVTIAEAMTRLDRCASHALLEDERPAPADPVAAAAVSRVRALLAEALALESAGRYGEAMEVASDALGRARALGDAEGEADALLRLGQVQGRLGRFGEMQQTLTDAAAAAQAAGYDRATGKAYVFLIIAAAHQGDFAEAHRWGELSRAVLERTADRDGVAAHRELFLGELARLEGRYEDAIEHDESYLRLGTHLGITGRAYAHLHLGRLYALTGSFDVARFQLDRALALFRQALGGGHRAIAQTWTTIGDLEARRGDPEAALGHYREALAILDRSGEADDLDTAAALEGTGRCLLALGRAGEAMAPLERALATRGTHPTRPVDLARVRFLLARALRPSGEPERARELALAARELLAAADPPEAVEIDEIDVWLGRPG